ncbi:MAG TPA: hypothetical protein VGB03_03635 [Acidimicrobiales bacterium]|jgi:hypothetical protein
MHYMKKLSVLALVAVAVVVGYQPASAAPVPTATELAVVGSINVSPSLSNASVNGTCAGGGTGGAGLCALATSGSISGLNCSTWSGTVSGTVVSSTGTLNKYNVRLNVTMTAGSLVITGTATDAAGSTHSVVGAGAATENQGFGSCLVAAGGSSLAWAGSLTIAA